MTSHLEAPGDTGLERARDECVDALVDWSVMPPGSGLHVREILDDFETAVRAQLAEGVQRLVTGVRLLFNLEGCDCNPEISTAPEHASDCPVYERWLPYEAVLRAAIEPFKATTVEEGRSDA